MKSHLLIPLLLPFFVHINSYSEEKKDSIWSQIWHENDNQELQRILNNDNLVYKGGLELKSSGSIPFGGLSALSANEDGSELLMISDFSSRRSLDKHHRSVWYKCQLSFGENNILTEASVINQGQMHHSDQTLVNGEIESMAIIKKLCYISFDNQEGLGNKIAIYPKNKFSSTDSETNWIATENQLEIPDFVSKSYKEGIEGMTETDNKELFLIHETKPGIKENTTRFGWIIDPKSHDVKKFSYVAHLKEIKAATTLPNGNIIVVEKSFNSSKRSTHLNLVEVKTTDIYKNILSGKVILDIESTLLDNFEGITSFVRDGKTYLLMVSDNNGDWNVDMIGDPIQKTLVLLFEYK